MNLFTKACNAAGVWKIPSWIAFRRDDQMAQSVTAVFTNCSCDNDSRSEKSHCFALGSVVATKFCPSSSSIRAHEHLDVVHSSRECLEESGALLVWLVR